MPTKDRCPNCRNKYGFFIDDVTCPSIDSSMFMIEAECEFCNSKVLLETERTAIHLKEKGREV